MIRKCIALIVMLLFVGMVINPSTGNILSLDDTIPPVTTHLLNPPEPDGENGYYVNDVEVMLNATDDDSGVKEIRYRIDGGSWEIITGNNGTFIMETDGNDVLIEYYAIDNVGNEEDINLFTIDMDQTKPLAEEIAWEAYKIGQIWYLDLIASAIDATSDMDRVECFIEDEHNETIEGAGPDYVFTFKWCKKIWGKWIYFYHYDKAGNEIVEDIYIPEPDPPPTRDLIGIICNREISEENVSFFAIVVFEPLSFKPFILEQVIFPNNYTGYIGRFFIRASFYEWYS